MTYAGARGPITLAQASKLDPKRYALQPKKDGQYCHVHTDRDGLVFAVTSRTSRPIETDLLGVDAGIAHAQLAGELTSHTERGAREREALGFFQVHVFDLISIEGRSLSELPYRQRRDVLQRCRGEHLFHDPDRPWFHDHNGRAHAAQGPHRGQFCRRVPEAHGRLPVVSQYPLTHLEILWHDVTKPDSETEGLVVIALNAPLGRRNSKRKLKPHSELDAVVISTDTKRAILHWPAADVYFSTGLNGRKDLHPGQIVEVRYEGYHDSLTPRFPRITRLRPDLQ